MRAQPWSWVLWYRTWNWHAARDVISGWRSGCHGCRCWRVWVSTCGSASTACGRSSRRKSRLGRCCSTSASTPCASGSRSVAGTPALRELPTLWGDGQGEWPGEGGGGGGARGGWRRVGTVEIWVGRLGQPSRTLTLFKTQRCKFCQEKVL